MAKLVIVESPAKAKTIGKYLGKDYEVTASMGHIRDLPTSQLGIDVEHDYTPQYINIKGKEKLIKELKAKAKKADGILLATDPDREGEAISWHLAGLLGIDPNQNQELVTEDEIKMMLMEGSQQGTIENDENEIIQNVFDMNDTTAEEVSTRRRDVVCLYLADEMDVWAQTIRDHLYTYFPVCGESQDDVVGVLNTKDYFRLDDLSRRSVMKHAVDKPFFVPEGIRADALFSRMKQERKYFAIVIDEYGGMSGIVTVHDLMEELVGTMDDEDTVRQVEIQKIGENCWEIRGSASLEEVAEELDVQLPTDEHETFNGLICGIVGRVPDEGEQFSCEGYGLKIDVKNVSGHRVETTVVEKAARTPDLEEDRRESDF